MFGIIEHYSPAKGTGWVRNTADGVDVWFHRTDVVGRHEEITKGLHVSFTTFDYQDHKGLDRRKATNITPVPQATHTPSPTLRDAATMAAKKNLNAPNRDSAVTDVSPASTETSRNNVRV